MRCFTVFLQWLFIDRYSLFLFSFTLEVIVQTSEHNNADTLDAENIIYSGTLFLLLLL